ncbi:MAG: preprotein translocase subunit SecY [Planctomycetota bacterium]|nr:preprotein translocase subunit SecY [Planctomycetota bacterium]MDP6957165.1 preprotein translocase subunit SecY [Planctomycetota bacterium]
MSQGFLQLFRIQETRQRILRTLGILLCYRIGFQVPIPGMDPQFLVRQDENALFGLMSALSGGAIGQTAIFALGIMPFISASIIFSMLTKISPTLEAVAKEGAAGQKKINQWTRLAVVPIAILQAVFIYTGVFLRNPQMVSDTMRDNPVSLGILVIASLVTGALLVMWLGELITEYGVGNGASLIIMAGIIASMPISMSQLVGTEEFWQTMLYMSGIWAVTVFVVVFMHKGARRIPIQYARLTRGRRVYGGQRHYLPLKVNMAGVMPIIFASVIFIVPSVLFQWLGWTYLRDVFNDQTGFAYVTIYLALVFFFCFFWNRLMFQPEEIAKNLREHGSFIPGIRPGASTAEYLGNTLTRITLAGAAFLAVIAVLPAFVTEGTGMTNDMRYFLGGTSVLIVVGVALELVDKLNSQLVMRNYEGFMKAGGPGWTRTGEKK